MLYADPPLPTLVSDLSNRHTNLIVVCFIRLSPKESLLQIGPVFAKKGKDELVGKIMFAALHVSMLTFLHCQPLDPRMNAGSLFVLP